MMQASESTTYEYCIVSLTSYAAEVVDRSSYLPGLLCGDTLSPTVHCVWLFEKGSEKDMERLTYEFDIAGDTQYTFRKLLNT